MVAASSASASSPKRFLGWNGLATSSSRSISSGVLRASSAPGISAPSPLPSPRLSAIQNLPREVEVSLRPSTADVVEDDRLAVAGRLAQPDVSRDHGAEHSPREVVADLPGHLLGQVDSTIVHREEDALDLQARVEPPLA